MARSLVDLIKGHSPFSKLARHVELEYERKGLGAKHSAEIGRAVAAKIARAKGKAPKRRRKGRKARGHTKGRHK